MEEVTKANQEHLAAITQYTKQFSPSKQHSSCHPPANHLLHGSNMRSTTSPLQSPPLLTPQVPPSNTCELITHPPPVQSAPLCPSLHLTNSPKALTPLIIAHPKEPVYCVLPLLPHVPGLGQTQSTHDLILPPPEAFSPPNTPAPSAYPPFHTQNCTWNSVLSLVQQPHLLWTVYTPKNLGEHANIKSPWQAWEKGIRKT
jgi:hypothetical protein